MKKRILCFCLALVSIFSICACSCVKSDTKYDYDMNQYISLPDFRSQVFDIEEDALKLAIGAYLIEFSSEYTVKRGDKVQVTLKFYDLVEPDVELKADEEIAELSKEEIWIENVATPDSNGNYQISSQIENAILNSKMGVTVGKLFTLDNTFYDEAYRGKKLFVDITIKNKVCEVGDVLTASYTGYHIDADGKIIQENGKDKSFDSSDNSPFYLGSNLAIDDFENGLIGLTIGEEKDIYATFPENYEAEPSLSGKRVLFRVKIKSFFTPPTYNDAFVTTYFKGFQNTAEFEASLRKEYTLSKVLDYINNNAQVFKFPEAEYQATAEQLESIAPTWEAQYGMTLDTYLYTKYGMTRDEYIKSNMKTEMIFYALRNMIGASVVPTETEIAAERDSLVLQYKNQYMQSEGLTDSQAISKANQMVDALGASYIYENVLYRKIDDIIPTLVQTRFIQSEKDYIFDAKTK